MFCIVLHHSVLFCSTQTVALDRDRDRGKGALPRSLVEVARGMKGDVRCLRARAAIKRDVQVVAVHSPDPLTRMSITVSPIRSPSSLEQRLKSAVQLARVEQGLYEVENRISCIKSQERGVPLLLSADHVLMNGMHMLCSVRNDVAAKDMRCTGFDSPVASRDLVVYDQSPSLLDTVDDNTVETLEQSEISTHNSRLVQMQQFRSRVGAMCEHLSSGCSKLTRPLPSGSHPVGGEGVMGAGRPKVLLIKHKDSSSWVHGPSPVAASAYIDSMLKYQMCVKNAELDRSQQMSLELQRGVLAAQSRRQREAGDAKEERIRVRKEHKEYVALAAEEKRVRVIESRRRERAERKALQILSERASKKADDDKVKLKSVADVAESVERVSALHMKERERRIAEDADALIEDGYRIKALQEHQHVLRGESAAEKKRGEEMQLLCRRERVKEHAEAATSRLRVGTFQWVGGVYGFYDNVQRDTVL